MLNELSNIGDLRNNRNCVISCTPTVKSMTSKYVDCRKPLSKTWEKKMNDLPEDILIEVPAFCDVDMFGLFLAKEAKKILKRYGAIFTCLFSCAVQLCLFSCDGFIDAVRWLVKRTRNNRIIRSENGTNL